MNTEFCSIIFCKIHINIYHAIFDWQLIEVLSNTKKRMCITSLLPIVSFLPLTGLFYDDYFCLISYFKSACLDTIFMKWWYLGFGMGKYYSSAINVPLEHGIFVLVGDRGKLELQVQSRMFFRLVKVVSICFYIILHRMDF